VTELWRVGYDNQLSINQSHPCNKIIRCVARHVPPTCQKSAFYSVLGLHWTGCTVK